MTNGTIITLIILIAVVTLVVIYLVKKKRQGKSICSCNCSECSLNCDKRKK